MFRTHRRMHTLIRILVVIRSIWLEKFLFNLVCSMVCLYVCVANFSVRLMLLSVLLQHQEPLNKIKWLNFVTAKLASETLIILLHLLSTFDGVVVAAATTTFHTTIIRCVCNFVNFNNLIRISISLAPFAPNNSNFNRYTHTYTWHDRKQ